MSLTERVIWAVVLSAPAIAVIIGMARYNVAVPYSDDLDLAPHIHTLVIDRDWSPRALHIRLNEHLVTAPVVLSAIITAAVSWDMHYLLAINIILAGLTVYLIHTIAAAPLSHVPLTDRLWLTLITTLFTFSFVFWEYWSHSTTMNLMLANTAFLGVVYAMTRQSYGSIALAAAWVLALVASLSASHGLLVWAAALPLLVSKHAPWPHYTAWAGGALVSIAVFMYALPSTTTIPTADLSVLLQRATIFFLLTMGAPVLNYLPIISGIIGSIIVAGILYLLNTARKQGRLFSTPYAAWLSISLFSFLATAALSLGRGLPGIYTRSAQSRFGLLSYLAVLVLMYLLYIMYYRPEKNTRRTLIAITAFFIIFHLANSTTALEKWRIRSTNLHAGRACALWYQQAPDECLGQLGNGLIKGDEVRRRLPLVNTLISH